MLKDKKFVYRFRGGETISSTKMSEKEGETFRKETDFSIRRVMKKLAAINREI